MNTYLISVDPEFYSGKNEIKVEAAGFVNNCGDLDIYITQYFIFKKKVMSFAKDTWYSVIMVNNFLSNEEMKTYSK